jgi:hypothetical protein
MSLFIALLLTLRDCLRSRACLQLEILAFRHQLHVLERSQARRLRLTRVDRLPWVWLSRGWRHWRMALVILKPDTVIAWQRRGFRLFWTWKRRHRTGRPTVPHEVRTLIRTMSAANPLWGAPRMQGELLKLGFTVSQTTVATYMSPTPATALADLAYVLDQPCTTADRGRLLHGADGNVPTPLRFGAARA